MFQSITYPVVRSSDRTVHASVGKLCEEAAVAVPSATFTLVLKQQTNQPIKFDVTNPLSGPPERTEGGRLQKVIDMDGCHLRTMEYKLANGARVVLGRPANEQGLLLQPDQLTLHLEISDEQEAMRLQNLAAKHFTLIKIYDLPQAVGHDLTSYLHAREATIQRLEDKIGEVTSKLTEYAIGLDTRYQAKLTALEQEYEARRTALATEQAAANAALTADREALERRAAEVDDRANVHARRQLYKDLKAIIQKRTAKFELTSDTKALRFYVWLISAVFIVLLLAGFGFCFYTNLTAPAANWVAIGSQIGFGVGLAAMVTFLIRWQNRWFLSHAEEEFRLQRLDLDMDRASWLVELVMEWKQESKDHPFPAELLARLAQGLFAAAERDGEMHPAETLASGVLANDGEVSFEPGKFMMRRKSK